MLDSIFKDGFSISLIIIIGLISLAIGFIFSFFISRFLRSSKGYFITLSLMPLIVASSIATLSMFLTSDTGLNLARIATIGVALGLIRFRSINGKAEELLLLLSMVVVGFIFGLGYIFYAILLAMIILILFIILTIFPIFQNKKFEREKLLNITIPESLNYSNIFDDIFMEFLESYKIVEIKTCNMGSMYRLSYQIIIKNNVFEKDLMDEIRVRNGNLDINLLPYRENEKQL